MTPPRYLVGLVSSFAAFAATPTQAQQLSGGGNVEISIIRILAALLICLAAAVALALAIRSRGGKAPINWRRFSSLSTSGRIRLIESQRLSLNAELCLVQCDGIEYLVISGPSGLHVINQQTLPEPADQA